MRRAPDYLLLLDSCAVCSRSSDGVISVVDDGSRMSLPMLYSDGRRVFGNPCVVSTSNVARDCRSFGSGNRCSKGIHSVSGAWPCPVLDNVMSLMIPGDKYACCADLRTNRKSVLAAAKVEYAALSSMVFNVVPNMCSLKLKSSWSWLSNRQYVPVSVTVALVMAGEPLG